jgi:6-phosphofructokinase 2
MDHHEAEFLAGGPLPERRDSADFAQSLVHRGAAKVVVVARGGDGSVLATRDERHHALAAEVPVISKIGAGDSFLGAFCLALARGKPLDRAQQLGMAAASAAVMTEATKLCRARDTRALVRHCHSTPI